MNGGARRRSSCVPSLFGFSASARRARPRAKPLWLRCLAGRPEGDPPDWGSVDSKTAATKNFAVAAHDARVGVNSPLDEEYRFRMLLEERPEARDPVREVRLFELVALVWHRLVWSPLVFAAARRRPRLVCGLFRLRMRSRAGYTDGKMTKWAAVTGNRSLHHRDRTELPRAPDALPRLSRGEKREPIPLRKESPTAGIPGGSVETNRSAPLPREIARRVIGVTREGARLR